MGKYEDLTLEERQKKLQKKLFATKEAGHQLATLHHLPESHYVAPKSDEKDPDIQGEKDVAADENTHAAANNEATDLAEADLSLRAAQSMDSMSSLVGELREIKGI